MIMMREETFNLSPFMISAITARGKHLKAAFAVGRMSHAGKKHCYDRSLQGFTTTRLVQALREGLRRRAQAAAQVPLRRQVHELQPVVAGHRLVAPARLQDLRGRDSVDELCFDARVGPALLGRRADDQKPFRHLSTY